MKTFYFKVNDSNGTEYILPIKALCHEDARNNAQRVCYKAGWCFLGRQEAI